MTYLGIDATGWAAWTAIGTLALAFVTVGAVIATLLQAKAERGRDDQKRAEDRAYDAARRAEDRERDERLRREAAEALALREAAERHATEDYEARQVLVMDEQIPHSGQGPTHQVIVSTPHSYPIKWVEGSLVLRDGGSLQIIGFGYAGETPYIDDNRVYYRFLADYPSSSLSRDAAPIVRFIDRHGNRYYQYRHFTERFSQNADFADAAVQLDKWMRLGPNPD